LIVKKDGIIQEIEISSLSTYKALREILYFHVNVGERVIKIEEIEKTNER
jgi:hypothetical protein